ncbi:MAG TPA: TetR/AcrR family transcriptional regulator [Solirubrobacteraceae bacterium]|jgi:AcrR family transcriptional regulator|nr:TetR/AcrR family transcriptional regulator [Solirubrobacteraceae bacterium]
MQRARIVDAMVAVVGEGGFADTSVTAVSARAKVSRRTFYRQFDGLEDCFLAVIDEAHRQSSTLIFAAFEQHERWCDGVRTALAGLLSFLDAEPRLARVWLVESLAAGAWALERREHHLAALTRSIVAHWSPPAGAEMHPLAGAGVIASILGVIQTHLVTRRPQPLITLLGSLMGIATAPYLDAAAVAAEIKNGEALAQEVGAQHGSRARESAAGLCLPAALQNPRGRRAWQCLRYLLECPGASNRQVANAIGIASHPQISTLLARLAAAELLLKHAGRRGQPNAWLLTPYGRQILDAHASHSAAPSRDSTVTS